MSELTREDFLSHIDLVRDDLREVKDHMIRMNGRIGASETDIAVLKATSPKITAAAWGGGIGGVVFGVVEAVRWLTGK